MKQFVYLASQSPRRAQLLDELGVKFELLLPDPSEDAESLELVLPGEAPLHYVKRVTQRKMQAAALRLKARSLPPAPILCSDTTVALGQTILGKPADAAQAIDMLTQLSGRTHRVLTAVALGSGQQVQWAVSQSRVTFATLKRQAIEAYVATGEPMGKAGAYAIQGYAARFVPTIQGSYTGIIGLPLFETAQLLRACGWKI